MSDPVAHRSASPRLATLLALELRGATTEVARRWLDRIVARVTLDASAVFPSEKLLDHVPLLVHGIADYLEHGTSTPDGHFRMEAEARELGEMRHAQGFDAYEILKEQELLSNIVYSFLRETLPRIAPPDTAPADVALCWQRAAEATEHIRQATMTHFLRISAEQVRQREERLRRFNRMVSHELKNHVSAIRGASALLAEPWLDAAQREKFLRMIADNGEALERVLENLLALSRLEGDARQQRNVLLPQAVAEAARQLRDAAALGRVAVRIDEHLPAVEVDAAAVELTLGNYLSNAIKYADPERQDRWVQISAALEPSSSARPGELVVRVRDNGRGVPPERRARLFEEFYRAHADEASEVDGTGLGLSIVRETIASLGGRTWAEFPAEGGSVFAFALPSRREEDAAAAGTRRRSTTTATRTVDSPQ